MSTQECVSCGKPKATLNCEVCGDAVCKKCEQLLPENTFSFLPEVPEDLKHTHYCNNCHDSVVAPELDRYQEVMEQAKGVYVFFTSQKKLPPYTSKEKESFKVDDCDDRDETILRLAFQAAMKGFNAIVDVEVKQEKIRKGAYQTSRWSGRGQGAHVNGDRVDADDKRRSVYGW